jgi:hypothetical protein
MIDFQVGEEFLVAVQRPYKIGEEVQAHGLKGRIVESISHQDYIEVWAYRGFASEAISVGAKCYYRCQRIGDKPPLTSLPAVGEPLRGDQESA